MINGGINIPSYHKICILSEYAYPLLTGKISRYGGAELQMTLLAKELVNRKYDVSFVTFEKSSVSPESIHGLKVYNPFNNKGTGYSYLNPHNLYLLLKVLNKINADIFIQRASTPLTGILAFYSQLKNKTFIFSSSSDRNVSDTLHISSMMEFKKLVYKYGVRHSDCVVCQTTHQKELLRKAIKKDGHVIKNIYIPPNEKYKKDFDAKKVLWVKRMGREKKPEIFLKLSKENPDVEFIMIGGISAIDVQYYNQIKQKAKAIKNLNFVGFVPHEQINKYYTEASILVNTSTREGFPNTFLEAWGNCTPVVSLNFDPDNLISKYDLGFHSSDYNSLVKDMYRLLDNKDLRRNMGMNGRKYVESEHSVSKIVDEYEKLFETLL
jgi:glycosyltransferase involved in cell wall biosynthesis